MNNQEYEQKKRQCWEEYWKPRKAYRRGDAAEMVHYDAFSYAFDRAFALGKIDGAKEQKECDDHERHELNSKETPHVQLSKTYKLRKELGRL